MGPLSGPGALRRAAISAGAALALLVPVTTASAQGTSPPLTVDQARLDAALACSGGSGASGKQPVLLIPGTTLDPADQYDYSWFRAFARTGRPYCALTIPERGMGDIQVAAEYVVNGIRRMSDRAGRRIDVVGHSQGGMSPRWALKYFPDTRADVDDLVGLAPSNHGTASAQLVCPAGTPCAPSIAQQQLGSRFLTALNRGPETFAGISYTSVYTRTDEVVTPNLDPFTGSSSLRTGAGARTNVAIQDVCPTDVAEHLAVGSFDNTAYQIAVDALDRPGLGRPLLLDRSICRDPTLPGVDDAALPANFARTTALAGQTLLAYPRSPGEPPLRAYAAG